MEHAIAAGAIFGSIVALGLGAAWHLGFSGLVLGSLLGALAGIVGGICLALYWAVEVPPQPAVAPDLWDPWLDVSEPQRGQVADAVIPAAREMAEPVARVRPRVLAPETGEALLLPDVIGPIVASRERGVIRLVGPPGSGKTTALGYLADVLPPHLGVSLIEDRHPSTSEAVEAALDLGWVVTTSAKTISSASEAVTNLQMAPWRQDEWIEYLLARDRASCASVMARLGIAKAEAARLDGIPELWRIVLDRMAADPSLPGPSCALRSELAHLLSEPERRALFEADCFAALCEPARRNENLHRHDPAEALFQLIRHRQIQLLLAAEWIAASIDRGTENETLAEPLPRDLVVEAAARLAGDALAEARMLFLIAQPDPSLQPMVASLLHALKIGWSPAKPPPCLAGAYLDEAVWPEIDLTRAKMQGTQLAAANLSRSRLDLADLENANLAGARLRGSSMERTMLDRANLCQACLAQVRAEGASFRSVQLFAAELSQAKLDWSIFEGADLTNARFADASLVRTDFRSAKTEGADFSRTDLTGAILQGLKLSSARFTGARFPHADLSGCDLEGMVLPGANFRDANLSKALLTGSSMRCADFCGAYLCGAGLAEVDWEGAILVGADLRGASFHLGSSRSGLVGSPIACEGSRTGFYTDDFDEQIYRSPEEIRKANLRGADLRGAKIDDVDFYLVDLRGARLGPGQTEHMRRCGAILQARA